MSDKLFLNFSLFFYIAIRGNVSGRTNPNILSVLTNNDPDSYQNYGSCTSYFVNGQRKLPKNLCAPILSLTIDEIAALLKRLNIQNIQRSLNIFTGLLTDDIIEIDAYIKNELLTFLTQEHDPAYCLARIYKEALCDTHPLLILTSSRKKEIDVYMERYSDNDRFILNSSKSNSYDSLSVTSFDFKKIFTATAVAISHRINKQTLPDQSVRSGWCRNLNQPDKVGIWATADGLCIAALTDCREPEYLKYRQNILDGLWKRRSPDGGFSNESQAFSSLEATAIVAKAFLLERDFSHATQAFQDLLAMWHKYKDSQYIGGISVVYLSQLLLLFCELNAPDEAVIEVENLILSKAIYDKANGNLLYWNPPSVPDFKGSAVHTAMSIHALLVSAQMHGNYKDTLQLLKTSGNWLLATSWNDISEITYRKCIISSDVICEDQTQYEHYAAPWCIRALLKLGYSRQQKRIFQEFQQLISEQKYGLWYYKSSCTPQIWVTHDAIECIHEYMGL